MPCKYRFQPFGDINIDLHNQATNLMETIMEFQQDDLTHDAITEHNIICPNGVLNKGVFIDFSSAQYLSHCPHRISNAVYIWYLLVQILGKRGVQTWLELKADQSLTDPEWKVILLEIRNSDKWTPYTQKEWEIAEKEDRRVEEAQS
jgi:hypothetical protein